MKRKTYLILIWSITLCVIVCSSTITFIKSKEIFTKVWNDVRNELEESFDFDFKFMSKNNDWNLNDNDASDFSSGKEFEVNLEEFSELIVDANIMCFQIKEGENWRIECSYSHNQLKPEFFNKNGTLYINQKSQIKHLAGSKNCDLLITVPANTELKKAVVKVNIGDIDISDLTVKKLETDVNIGDFKIEDFNNFDDYNVNLKADLGEIKIHRNSYGKKMLQKRNSSKKIDIEINIGQIDIM